MKETFIVLLLFVSLSTRSQNTYYIDPSGSDDTGKGTVSSPWKSLNKACATVKTSGDIIHVNSGIYNETEQSLLVAGVSIEGVGSASVINSHFTKGYSISLYSPKEGINGNQHISNIKMDGNYYTAYGAISIFGRSNVEIYNCTFINFSDYGVSFKAGLKAPPGIFATANSFHDNIETNCAGQTGGEDDNKDALEINGQDGMLIYNNRISDNRASGLNGNCIGGVEGYLKNVKIYNNTLHKTFVPGITPWDFALEFWDFLGGVEIYDNDINGSIDVGGYLNIKGSSEYSVWIHDNMIGQSALLSSGSVRGILIESSTNDVIIERNLIKNVANGIYFSQFQDFRKVTNIRLSYNIFDNIGVSDEGTDSLGWGINWASENNHNHIVDNINIWNNVFIGSTGARSNMWGINLPNIGTATNVSIKNNIIENFDYCPIFSNDDSGIASIDILSIENNIFYNNGNNNLPKYSEIRPSHTITQNNLISNPLFVSSSDFHLQFTSPAHTDPGLYVGLTLDYDSVEVLNPPDRGAYECHKCRNY